MRAIWQIISGKDSFHNQWVSFYTGSQYLGIEAYGLIGLFAVLQAWLALLDMGLTPRRFQVRALASRGHGAAGRRSRGSAPHRMLAVHEPAMTDPTRREEHDAPGKTRLERYFQDGGCEGGGLGLCWIPIATRRAPCFRPRRLDAERAGRWTGRFRREDCYDRASLR